MLRARGSDGRFGVWESRSAPAAGGLHGISILVLPLTMGRSAGIYDPDRHALLAPRADGLASALDGNRLEIVELLGAKEGTTLQFVADVERYASCYGEPGSLIWRDSGALAATVTLVATLFSLRSVIIGRKGDSVVRAADLLYPWLAVGGVHLCS